MPTAPVRQASSAKKESGDLLDFSRNDGPVNQ